MASGLRFPTGGFQSITCSLWSRLGRGVGGGHRKGASGARQSVSPEGPKTRLVPPTGTLRKRRRREAALKNSTFKAVLNEGEITRTKPIKLPKSHRGRIIPDDLFVQRKHPDIRIARRATTIASLARVISEREVSMGLRKTLRTQAQRLEKLAADRYAELAKSPPPKETEI